MISLHAFAIIMGNGASPVLSISTTSLESKSTRLVLSTCANLHVFIGRRNDPYTALYAICCSASVMLYVAYSLYFLRFIKCRRSTISHACPKGYSDKGMEWIVFLYLSIHQFIK